MFPADAGMNRSRYAGTRYHYNVPRRRGDEPVEDLGEELGHLCSPQTRG